MAKTKKEKQFELNQLMEMKAPQQSWLTNEIYENWLKNKSEIKARHTARLIIQDLFPQDSHQLNPEPVWGSYEVDESPKTLVDKWKDGELISNPETGQDPKRYSGPNLKTASTPSYPSGHQSQGSMAAEVLSSVYPEHKSQWNKFAALTGDARIMQGVHYSTDNEVSKTLARILWENMKDNLDDKWTDLIKE